MTALISAVWHVMTMLQCNIGGGYLPVLWPQTLCARRAALSSASILTNVYAQVRRGLCRADRRAAAPASQLIVIAVVDAASPLLVLTYCSLSHIYELLPDPRLA